MPPETLDSLDKDDLKPLVLQLLGQNGELFKRIDTLLARIAKLEARAGQPPKTPSNSSLPPSTGHKPNRPETPKKGRKGRPGVSRALCPDPDATREIYVEHCCCGAALFRKVTGGFRSVWGAESYADIRSIVATGRLNGRSPLAAIRAALA